ncbi:hypothetical protein ABK040_002119 [Willaertia magna]
MFESAFESNPEDNRPKRFSLVDPFKRKQSGKLIVKVIEARKLAAKDIFTNSSDPYCKIELEPHELRTSIIYRNLNPMWNEEFSLEIFTHEFIKITVMDHDDIGQDDFLGFIEIPIQSITSPSNTTTLQVTADAMSVTTDRWYKLKARNLKDKISGEIHLQFKYFPNLSNTMSKKNSSNSRRRDTRVRVKKDSNDGSNINQHFQSVTPLGVTLNNQLINNLCEQPTTSITTSNNLINEIENEEEEDLTSSQNISTPTLSILDFIKSESNLRNCIYLKEFLENDLSNENLECLLAIENYKLKLKRKYFKCAKQMALYVFNNFIKFGSEKEIYLNLERKIYYNELFNFISVRRNKKNEWMTKDLFDDITHHLAHLIESDIFPRFVKSTHFQEYNSVMEWSFQFNEITNFSKIKRRVLLNAFLEQVLDDEDVLFLKKKILQREKKERLDEWDREEGEECLWDLNFKEWLVREEDLMDDEDEEDSSDDEGEVKVVDELDIKEEQKDEKIETNASTTVNSDIDGSENAILNNNEGLTMPPKQEEKISKEVDNTTIVNDINTNNESNNDDSTELLPSPPSANSSKRGSMLKEGTKKVEEQNNKDTPTTPTDTTNVNPKVLNASSIVFSSHLNLKQGLSKTNNNNKENKENNNNNSSLINKLRKSKNASLDATSPPILGTSNQAEIDNKEERNLGQKRRSLSSKLWSKMKIFERNSEK